MLSSLEDESRKLHYRQAFAMDPKQVTLEDQEESLRSITMFNRYGSMLVQRLVQELPLDLGTHWVLTL